jgi:hypothetical protein
VGRRQKLFDSRRIRRRNVRHSQDVDRRARRCAGLQLQSKLSRCLEDGDAIGNALLPGEAQIEVPTHPSAPSYTPQDD